MIRLLLSGGWALGLLAAFLWAPTNTRLREKWMKWSVVIIFSLAIFVRLVPNFLLSDTWNNDIHSYRIVAQKLEAGVDVYSDPESRNRHPYLPLEMYWMDVANRVAGKFHLAYPMIVRLQPIITDALVAVVVYLLLKKIGSIETAVLGGVLYALNPIPVFVSAYHGQFDAVPALMILLALFFYTNSSALTGFWLGLGVLTKSWPIMALPAIFQHTPTFKKRVWLLGLTALVPIFGLMFYVIVFHANPLTVLMKAMGYNSGVGNWGYSLFIRIASIKVPLFQPVFQFIISNGRYFTLAGLSVAWFLWIRKEKPVEGVLTTLLIFFSITHAFAIQYLTWLIPFAIIGREFKWLKLFTLAAFSHMLLTYMTVIMGLTINQLIPWLQADYWLILPSTLPAWGIVLWWTICRLRTTGKVESSKSVEINERPVLSDSVAV